MDPVLITQYRAIAESLIGPVDWQNDVKGFCPCPGRELHSSASSRRDCVVFVDSDRAPSCYCMHTSCADVLAQRNRALRSGCGKAKWAADRGAATTTPAVAPSSTAEERARQRRKKKLEGLADRARRGAATLIRECAWPAADIASPVALDSDPSTHWQHFLSLFESRDVIWIGDRYDSGEPSHQPFFRTVSAWRENPPKGPLASASIFKTDCYARTRDNVIRTPFLVVESDTLTRDEITAIFRFLRERMHLGLRAIIDTGGRSLHGWFDQPHHGRRRDELLVVLQALGCDPGPWREPSMSRLPGALRQRGRETRRQRLLWFDPHPKKVEQVDQFSTNTRARDI